MSNLTLEHVYKIYTLIFGLLYSGGQGIMNNKIFYVNNLISSHRTQKIRKKKESSAKNKAVGTIGKTVRQKEKENLHIHDMKII